MILILTFLFLFQLVSADNHQEIGPFPYFVSIRYSSNDIALCGGAVIHSQWILSTGSCLDGTTGVFVFNDNLHYEDKYYIKNIRIHPEFSNNHNNKITEDIYYNNDIALIQVNQTIYVQPIALGKIEIGANVLSMAYRHDITFAKEQRFYNLTTIISSPNFCKDSDEFICTGLQNINTYCLWHRGALLIDQSGNQDRLVGIGSHFENMCDIRHGGVFTRVANYVNWIFYVTGIDFLVL